jgi:hypothetical protein
MTSIIADSHVQAALGGFVEPVEIHDSSGKLLGTFMPAAADLGWAYEEARAHFDPAELKRRNEDNPPGITTAEMLAKFHSLERQ